jgi:hypothetical protein
MANRTGLFIIRAWIEEGSSEPLRAHVRLSTDISAGVERTLTLVRPEAVCATVQEWLADILSETERAERPD